MKKQILTLALALSITGLTAQAQVETYKIDTSHSSVKFSIRHFIAKTVGTFENFEGTIIVDRDDITNSKIEATVKIPSVDTDSEKRDKHLQEDDYFDASKYPEMTFSSTKWVKKSENKFMVTGDLSIRGISKPVTLEVELLGFGEGMRGAYLSGWEATTTLDRTEWGVNGGQPAVGTEVEVTINIEAIRQ